MAEVIRDRNGVDDDRAAIERLAAELGAADVRVTAEVSDMLPDAAGDVLVAVLSPNSVKTPLLDDLPDPLPGTPRGRHRAGRHRVLRGPVGGQPPVEVTAGVDGLLRRLQQAAARVDSAAPQMVFNQEKKVILFLTTSHLREMLDIKDRGGDPSVFILDAVDSFLIQH
ncbi:hypothetical protein JIG36_11205 [Actinoplanes sp. LDG1-06]|uniref:Uncharacterized protein n=1 Tax=Paractinoplanes ovalisporus TaxID=2810368 RepID=A0ABS2A8F3_9ACTN|nr:ELKS/Rab6-interacting/CAST family protein [Actinoplanes ovalisporus]MBM2616124.1 hypothetical protein [Actinoplanes ovalisporus]